MELKINGLKVDAGGEGSKGGHVVSHTSSGKPIYASRGAPKKMTSFERHQHTLLSNDIVGWFNDKHMGTKGMMGRRYPDVDKDFLFKTISKPGGVAGGRSWPGLDRAKFDKALKRVKKTLGIK